MNIEALATQAGIEEWWSSGNEHRETLQEHLERFAAIHREAVVQELVAGSGEPAGEVIKGVARLYKLEDRVDGRVVFTRDQLAGAVLRKEQQILEFLEDRELREKWKQFQSGAAIREQHDEEMEPHDQNWRHGEEV